MKNYQPLIILRPKTWFLGVSVDVESESRPGIFHEVIDLDKPRAECSCEQYRFRLQYQQHGECKHAQIARKWLYPDSEVL